MENFLDLQTGLFNETYFQELIKKECNRCLRHKVDLSVLMIDLDFYKTIMQSYSLDVSNKCLTEFADKARNMLRNYDSLCYFSDGKFGALVPGTNVEQAVQVAERIRKVVEKIKVYSGKNKIPLTISVGVSTLSPRDKTSYDFVGRASRALANANSMGKNKVCKFL